MQRALLTSSGLRMAAAGYDPATAPADKMIIDTTARRYLGFFASGSIPFSSFTQTYSQFGAQQGLLSYSYELLFGKTFAAPPIVKVGVQNPLLTDGNAFMPLYADNRLNAVYTSDGQVIFYGSVTSLSVSTSTTKAVFLFNIVVFSYSGWQFPAPPSTIYYAIGRS